MQYLVTAEFIEEYLAGKTPEESAMYVQQVIKPSLEALWKLAQERRSSVASSRASGRLISWSTSTRTPRSRGSSGAYLSGER